MRTFNSILFLFVLFGFNILGYSQVDGQDSVNTVKDFSKEYKIENRLFIKRQGKKKKVRVKEGALVNCQLMDYTYTGVSELKIITDEGLYLAPYKVVTDSIDTKRKRNEIVAIASDTIIYIKYIDILNFNFRNQVKNQNDGASVLLFTGSELIFAPLIVTPFIYGSVESVPTKIIVGSMIAGIPFVLSGIIWKIMLRKFRSYPMQLYEFHLIKKTV